MNLTRTVLIVLVVLPVIASVLYLICWALAPRVN